MNATRPILIIQMHRMGDVVLSFPLMLALQNLYPQQDIWVLGERAFFEPLLPLSPQVTYFEHASLPILADKKYSMVVNLSHSQEAALFAGKVDTEILYGRYIRPHETAQRISGFWHLYRHSIVHNNRHNLFHWADLNLLDICPPTLVCHTPRLATPPPQATSSSDGRIGLFVGASEEDKRPDSAFWASLAAELLRRGFKPVFLGGPDDYAIAHEAAVQLRQPHLNLAGRFSIAQLSAFLHELDTLVTPDTGPMHVAAWIQTRVLNLSLGPVNPWETAPIQPGHSVLRASISCSGCWRCSREGIPCKTIITPGMAASVCDYLHTSSSMLPHGVQLCTTGRSGDGLFDLRPMAGTATLHNSQRLHLSRFWQAWFSLLHLQETGKHDGHPLKPMRDILRNNFLNERLRKRFIIGLKDLHIELARAIRKADITGLARHDHWREALPLLRPWSSFMASALQNEDFSHSVLKRYLQHTECLIHLLTE